VIVSTTQPYWGLAANISSHPGIPRRLGEPRESITTSLYSVSAMSSA
jgi:hypothetical protein